MNTEKKIVAGIENQLQSILGKIPAISALLIRRDVGGAGAGFNLIANFNLEGKQTEIIVDLRDSVSPKGLRSMCEQIRGRILKASENTYPMIAANYFSEASIEVCKEFGIGCLDLQGNCHIAFDSLYVEISGRKNENPAATTLRSAFSPKSSRVSRVLLSDPGRWWQIQEVANAAEVSIGLVSNVKVRLLDEELLQELGKRIRVKSPERLIKTWLEKYSYRSNERREYYSLESSAALEISLAGACGELEIPYALGLFSGANKVAPFVRMEKVFAYISVNIDFVAERLGLKRVSSGANVVLLSPYDQGVFYGSRIVEGVQVASDLQLYLDLKTYRGRGEEAADELYRKILEPQWQLAQTTNQGK